MTRDIKQRLFISVVALVIGTLYVGPLFVHFKQNEIQDELYWECATNPVMYDRCWAISDWKASLPFETYVLPFVPAIVVLWLNWLLKTDLRLSEEKYPRKTFHSLVWLGLICAALAIGLPFWHIISSSPSEIHKIANRVYWGVSYLAAGWLIAPLIFHHLFAPPKLIGQAKNGTIALCIVTLTPFVALLLAAFRQPDSLKLWGILSGVL